MKIYSTLFNVFFFLALIMLHSCDRIKKELTLDAELLKPDSTGEMGEILVVINKKYWEGSIDKSLNKHFSQYITTTPFPYEKEFDLKYVDPKGFNKLTNTFKTILYFNLDNNTKKSKLSLPPPIKNRYAKNQILYEFPKMSEETILVFLDRYADSIKKCLTADYLISLTTSLKDNIIINEALNQQHNLSLLLPVGMELIKSSPEFTMVRKTQFKSDDNGDHEIQQRIFIYSYPYNDQLLLTKKKQIYLRDSILKKHVPGRVDGSYMTTAKDEDTLIIISKRHIHNDDFILETRGRWRVENDRMGGAFINISVYDEPKNRIVTIEGNVYAPAFGKRELIRELKAVIYSYSFN